ncbi:hypothetical protein BDN71DRAFT_1358115, partial [Pleurotus eryngii]
LQVLKHATLFFSRETPNLATVIPAMDHIDQSLATVSINIKYNPAVRPAIAVAIQTLNQYYSLTDVSEAYQVAM